MTHAHYQRIRRVTGSDIHRCLLDIAYYTGLRWATILRLDWSAVYRDDNTPRDTIVCPGCTTKNRMSHEIPIHPDLRILLAAIPVRRDRVKVIPISISAADKQYRRAIRKAGLTGLGLSRHSTRRGFVTQLHAAGVGIRTIQRLSGHRSLGSVQRYIEVTDIDLSHAIDTIGRGV